MLLEPRANASTETDPAGRSPQASDAGEVAVALLDALWTSPTPIAIFDRELRFVRVNEALARVEGIPPDAHRGRRLGELYSGPGWPPVVDRIEERIGLVLETREPSTLEVRSPLARSPAADWRCTFYPVAGPGSEVRGVCGIFANVTAERERVESLSRARDDAERTSKRLALLQGVTAAVSAAHDVSEVARVVVESVARALDASAAVLRLLGPDGQLERFADAGTPGAALVGPVRVALDADLPMSMAARLKEAVWLESRATIEERYPALSKAGAWIAAYAAVPLTAGERVLGTVGLVFDAPRGFDLEERAFVLALAQQSAQALERAGLFDSERRLREEAERARSVLDAIFDNAPIGIGLWDRDLRFVRVNPRLAEMNGIPPEAHVGKTVGEVLPGVPREDVEAGWRRVLSTGEPVLDVEISGETPAMPGKVRQWVESWYPVKAGGQVLGVGAIVREVTVEREAEEFQRNVLGIVGHDLRNPLAAIVTSARLSARGRASGGDGARLAERILANASRMGRIIDVLVDYARVRGGQNVPIRPRACDLAAICRAVADECEASHPGRRVATGGQGDVSGEWDADRIGQVVANLVSNALDYSPPDSVVEVTWRAAAREASIEVANDGPPIPAEALPRIFEPFRRAARERSDRNGGLGLGLFIARAIATAHGGRIEVRSSPGERTAFTLHLPRGADARAAGAPSSLSPRAR